MKKAVRIATYSILCFMVTRLVACSGSSTEAEISTVGGTPAIAAGGQGDATAGSNNSQGGAPVFGSVTAGGTTTTGKGGTTASGGATGKGGTAATGGANLGGATGSVGVQTGGASSGGSVSIGGTGVTLPEPPTPQSGDLWVSPNGNDSSSGSKDSPLKSLATAIPKLTPGKTIWMTAGTHLFTSTVIFPRSMKGTASQMYRVAGDPSGPRPVLDFMGVNRSSEIRALQIDGEFWHLRYLEVQNPSDNGLNVAGSNNILELLAVHDCGDTGVQISGTNSLLPSHNKVINCDSYMNADNSAENADGFAAKLDIGPGNAFYGCRAWYNVDDGWDHYEAGRNPVILENCWSFGAKHPTKSKPNSDGNGFKMGGQRREIGWHDVLPADSPIKVQYPT